MKLAEWSDFGKQKSMLLASGAFVRALQEIYEKQKRLGRLGSMNFGKKFIAYSDGLPRNAGPLLGNPARLAGRFVLLLEDKACCSTSFVSLCSCYLTSRNRLAMVPSVFAFPCLKRSSCSHESVGLRDGTFVGGWPNQHTDLAFMLPAASQGSF